MRRKRPLRLDKVFFCGLRRCPVGSDHVGYQSKISEASQELRIDNVAHFNEWRGDSMRPLGNCSMWLTSYAISVAAERQAWENGKRWI
jgi:hypothetical protein